jgi:hypothetical protein
MANLQRRLKAGCSQDWLPHAGQQNVKLLLRGS